MSDIAYAAERTMNRPPIQIKHRHTGAVLFEFAPTDEQHASGMALRHALEAANKAGADLRGAYLSDADLRDADLRGAYLSDADLRDADLSDADLRGAYLSDADLRGADLSDANLSGADLGGANLSDADLRDANLRDANLRGAYLRDANLRGAYLRGAYLRGAYLRDDIKIDRAPLQVLGLFWPVIIFDAHMQIGCEFHSLDEWRGFDDARIVQMDGRDALRFWRAHKDHLLALAAADGRGVVPASQEAA